VTTIKICGLTDLRDARWAWRCGADLLGFIFVRSSPRFLPTAEAAVITRSLREEGCTARLVGVFVDAPVEVVQRTVEACSLDIAQLHGDEDPEYVRTLGVPAIVARRVRGRVPWEQLARHDAWAYLLDTYHPRKKGGSGHSWDWSLLRRADLSDLRIIVAGGLTPQNVTTAMRQAEPWGVDVSSGVEASPGRKDRTAVERLIRNVKKEDGV
jgi:phosphoribosylanthranilate isomerase